MRPLRRRGGIPQRSGPAARRAARARARKGGAPVPGRACPPRPVRSPTTCSGPACPAPLPRARSRLTRPPARPPRAPRAAAGRAARRQRRGAGRHPAPPATPPRSAPAAIRAGRRARQTCRCARRTRRRCARRSPPPRLLLFSLPLTLLYSPSSRAAPPLLLFSAAGRRGSPWPSLHSLRGRSGARLQHVQVLEQALQRAVVRVPFRLPGEPRQSGAATPARERRTPPRPGAARPGGAGGRAGGRAEPPTRRTRRARGRSAPRVARPAATARPQVQPSGFRCSPVAGRRAACACDEPRSPRRRALRASGGRWREDGGSGARKVAR